MCNLYAATTPQQALRGLFDVAPGQDRLGNLAPLPAIYPRYTAPVVRLDGDGAREMVAMHWGFLLPQTSSKTGKPILPKAVNNARDDKVRLSRFWAESFAMRRCLVPATSFAEAQGRKPATHHWFGLASDDPAARPPFAFAGLWRRFRGEYRGERVEIDTHTIITTAPNDLVRPVHPDRMPVILAAEDHETWLSGPPEQAAELMRPFPAARMRIVRKGEGVTQDPA
jgi:putative SOS response-associated peptidase YedK